MNKNKAIFIDRDGTIIKDKGYLSNPNEVEFIDGVVPALKKFTVYGYILIIVTNQSGIGRGIVSLDDLTLIHARIISGLSEHSININGIYTCPHYIGSEVSDYNMKCRCCKPAPGLLLHAAREHNIELSESYMIGDKESDVMAGVNAGVKESFLIEGNYGLLYYADCI
jgi:D-glycero-D-manno-heptose 1,7-bisphosphate phosphatase